MGGLSVGPDGTGYELVDAGVRRRLERFGPVVVDRPAPGVDEFRRAPAGWADADLRFDPGAGWSGPAAPAAPWLIELDGLTLELRPTSAGGLGLYPEHALNLAWLAEQVEARGTARRDAPPLVLNLFAHTGLATLAVARAGASVVHLDGARTAVDWARRNAALSGLADRPVRWLVDDAAAFVAREARRGRQYDGIVLDPPAFGRSGRREWRLAEDLPGLVAGCGPILAPGGFVLLTAHSESIDGGGLSAVLRDELTAGRRPIEATALVLEAASGARLPLGWTARIGATPDLGSAARPGP